MEESVMASGEEVPGSEATREHLPVGVAGEGQDTGGHLGMEALDMGDVNGNSTKGVPTQPLSEALTDAGRFAYCGLVTAALYRLFVDTNTPDADKTADTDFALATLARLTRHLGLPSQVREVMELTVRGEVQPGPSSGYVTILREEPPLARSCVPVVQDLVMFAVQGGCYDARIRVLIMHVTCLLHVSVDLLEMYEESVLEYLTMEQNPVTEEEEKEMAKRERYKKIKRYTAIGLATLGGGAVLGLTGGLAAPFIGAGLGTIIGAGGAAALSSTAGVAVVGSMFGAAGAGLTGFKMQKRIGDIEEFAFDYLTDGSHLHITIAISGWLTKEGIREFSQPWRILFHSREQYCLRYESQYLRELGQAMDYLLQFALSMAVQETLKYTILAGIISAITWPSSLLTLASVIDNPWGVCCRRSAEVGKQLAEVLSQRQHGKRPVTLIGFSLGARVIYYCLQELGRRKGSAGIIQDAILLGAPVPGYAKEWQSFRHIVSGRIINGYCQGDWLLRFLYRSSSGSLRIAGLMPIDWQDRRMFNFDLSDIVTGHMDYANKMDVILRLLGIRTRDPVNEEFLRMKKSASDYPSLKSMHGKMTVSELRTSTSDSTLVCGRDAPLSRSFSSDDLHISRSTSSCDQQDNVNLQDITKHRTLSSYDLASKKCIPLGDIGPRSSISHESVKSLASSDQHVNQAGIIYDQEAMDVKEQTTSKPFFGNFLSRKHTHPPQVVYREHQTLAQDMFKRRTMSSGNLFATKPGQPGKIGLQRSNSQDQSKQSIFQIFSRKQEPIEET
ncbi:transmembrane and coiled-coil domain-containing protein 4 [Procambarus clarkii]|uniref:transmembrane and coiled-coil domain-containing protein 4 n=1 Tax=Procambarus clarkii TaxID=6728 RepID=UPI001E677525|nr:transmembrane and coiled-coil domain-containing protein 4-like isoform X2 [Procambarus clarkii]